MAAVTSLPSKVVRAIRWYFLQNGATDSEHCLHNFDWRERKFNGQPIVDVLLMPMGPDVLFTGNDTFIVEIQVKNQITEQPDENDSELRRVELDTTIGAVRSLMMLSDDGGQTINATRTAINQAAYTLPIPPANATEAQTKFAANNADMDDFTILEISNLAYGNIKSDECNCAVGQRFRVVACETKIAGY